MKRLEYNVEGINMVAYEEFVRKVTEVIGSGLNEEEYKLATDQLMTEFRASQGLPPVAPFARYTASYLEYQVAQDEIDDDIFGSV
jgi:hypothetical protein